jgi:hypothetical protein
MNIGKASNSLYLKLPRDISRKYYGVAQKKIHTRLKDSPENQKRLEKVLVVIRLI